MQDRTLALTYTCSPHTHFVRHTQHCQDSNCLRVVGSPLQLWVVLLSSTPITNQERHPTPTRRQQHPLEMKTPPNPHPCRAYNCNPSRTPQGPTLRHAPPAVTQNHPVHCFYSFHRRSTLCCRQKSLCPTLSVDGQKHVQHSGRQATTSKDVHAATYALCSKTHLVPPCNTH